jgi:hypothetical protein
MDEEAEGMNIGERFPQLLQGPLCAGMIGDIAVQDSAPAQFRRTNT